MVEYEVVYEDVKKLVSEKRFKHSEGVVQRALEYAQIYGADENEVKLSAIAHDIAKELPKDKIISYALKFLGNPYVWGGTDPVHGADCSGFAQHVYAQFGIGLPRTSAAQSQYGMKIPVSEAAPGDLIFYAKNGQVYHVVIYIGNGRTVEAASTRSGICSHGVNYANAVWATRLLS